MIDELNQLRADLEVVNNIRVRYQSDIRLTEIRDDLYEKIAKLEAAADPWREAKESIDHWRNCGMWPDITGLYDHLTAENERMAKRVKELEAEIKAEDGADIADAEKALAEMVRANQDMGLYEANADTSEHKPRRPHDRITMQRRIKMQRRELRRLNKKMYDQAFERHRLKCRIAELEDGLAAIDPDGYQLGDFRVMKTAQEIARYAMDRNMDQPVTVKTARRAIWAIKEFVEQARHWHGLSKLKPYRWTSIGRDDTSFIDEDFDATESPCDYDPDAHKPLGDMQPPFEGPIVGIEPVLDPARVLATAAVRLDEMHISGGAYLRNYTDGARPYRMCERSVSIAFVDDLEVEPKRAIATTKNIVEAAGWLKTANDLKRFLAEMGGSGSIPYRTKGETNELA